MAIGRPSVSDENVRCGPFRTIIQGEVDSTAHAMRQSSAGGSGAGSSHTGSERRRKAERSCGKNMTVKKPSIGQPFKSVLPENGF